MCALRRTAVPWWVRLGAKLVLARLPIGYAAWRRADIRRAFADAGYDVLECTTDHWAAPAIEHPEFRDLPDADLRVRGIDLFARKPC